MAQTSDEQLAGLPETFRTAEALDHLSERQFRRLKDDGRIIALARGLYRKSDWLGDEDLIEIATKAPQATLCLRSALARHELVDDIPAEIDIAIPRGTWTPTTAAPVRWRHFDLRTFDVGRGQLDIDAGRSIGLYSAERTLIDLFRLRHAWGSDLALGALKQWLRERDNSPGSLVTMAEDFPKARPAIQQALEVLL